MKKCTRLYTVVAVFSFVFVSAFALHILSYADSDLPFPRILRQHHVNRRYFAGPTGDIVYLTGSHTWCNLQDIGKTDPPAPFDF